jgi:hypothetical protein
MGDETANRPAEAPDGRGHPGGGEGEPAPLQSRSHFLQNRDWASVTQINAGLCQRGGAQHGINTETHQAVAEDWERIRSSEITLLETLQLLRSCHRRAPFLFFNGNTFAEIGRALITALLADLPLLRRKETASAAAHFVTGVLDQESMENAFASLLKVVQFAPGQRVKTLRGSLHGVIVRILDDGRVAWRPDGASTELIALPESLAPDD